jgi:hypothetical protein
MALVVYCSISMPVSVAFLQDSNDAIPADPPARWWKGNLHTHSFWSDGNDFPEMISEWYRVRGYNFLAISDHNTLQEGDRWMKYDTIVKRGGKEAIEKYQKRFGGGWIETKGEEGTEKYQFRLKPLDEYRYLLEERGKFILIPAEEITDRAGDKPVHMNATNLVEKIEPLGGKTVREVMENNLRSVLEQEKAKGREILPHLNHPNFGYGITFEDLAAVVSERFFEVYNGHPGVNHLGNKENPGVERMWDLANHLRINKLDSPVLMGVATDDSHEYHGKPGSRPGRGSDPRASDSSDEGGGLLFFQRSGAARCSVGCRQLDAGSQGRPAGRGGVHDRVPGDQCRRRRGADRTRRRDQHGQKSQVPVAGGGVVCACRDHQQSSPR